MMAETTPVTTSDDDLLAGPQSDSPTGSNVSEGDERDGPAAVSQHPEATASVGSPDETTAAASPSVEPLVDIQLDRSIPAEWMRNRRDVVISGLAVAEQPIEAISLVVNNEVKAVALYGRAESQQVFRLTLAERQDLARGLTPFVVMARTHDGQEHEVSFRIVTDPDDPRAARVIKGVVRELSLPMKTRIPILLDVEMAAVDTNNVLHVRGWATAHTQIMTVQVLIDEQVVGSPPVGQMRDDIAAAYPGYSNASHSGFSFSESLPSGEAPRFIAVEAIDLGGSVIRVVVPLEFNASLPEPSVPVEVAPPPPRAQPEQDRRRAIFAHCDAVTLCTDGQLLVAGWVVCATGISAIEVRLDDEVVGEAELGLPRPDVAQEYDGIPQARYSGFSFKRQLAAPVSGDHQVSILARNGLDDTQTLVRAVSATDPLAVAPQPAPTAVADPQDFRFQLDHPTVIDGAASDTVIGRLVIEGWALARSGVEAIDVYLDGRMLGQAYYGTARRDVETAFPNWENAFRSGYVFHCPPRVLETGTHTIRLELRAKGGGSFATEFQIDVQQSQDSEDYATIRRRMSRSEIDLYQDILDRLECRPHFRLVLATGDSIVPEQIEATLRSLGGQAYRDWQLVIVADDAEHAGLVAIATRAGLQDQVTSISANAAPEALIPASAAGATCLIGVLCPGDILGCDALAEIAIARGQHADAQLFYADEDRVSPSSHVREPFFKPDWSPDLLLSTNYIGHAWFASAALFAKAGITPQSLSEPWGDYDAILRCTELASGIHHLAKLLSRRDDAEPADQEGERRVLQAAALRRGIQAEVLPGCVAGTWRMKRTAAHKGKVSIIIPTCAAQGYVATCLTTLRERTAYRDFEIICIDNIPDSMPEWKELIRRDADKVVEIPEAFNWSRFNNRAAEQAEGEYLLFLNDDIEIEHDDWLDALLEHAQRPEIGVVGPQLLYPDRKVQHAGIFLTTLGAGRHSFRFLAEDDPGYFGLALTQRNVIAVTGACMLMRREVFESIGRFDEAHEVVNNDVDCCLRAWQSGYTIVYTPYSQLIHHELASRANIKDIFDAGHFAKQWWTQYASGDPFFSPRLTKFADEYRPDTEPARVICASRPLFSMDELQRILVVKLDHIGDLITVLPALRRLRRHFPAARIHMLASAAAKAFLAGENCVDELIEFEFFHERSGLGQKDLTEEDLRALGERLAPYRFDMAIDLRKQLETRHILQFIPARFRAGYNHLGRFPWLDVALEWEGDNQLRRKQSHVSDDLVRMVDAVATAGEMERSILPQARTSDGKLPAGIPDDARALFDKPVVAVHPGVGAIMRQWPAEYFATVVDLLIEKNGVNVVLIGGRDEVELVEEVLGHVLNRQAVVSLAGRTSLADLTGLLCACALYLGNNSGPKHIAAALGVPTIGIHSGVVDAAEWGPIGPRAIALQRNMVCSPCYLVNLEDCVRDMACLKRLEPAVVHQYCEMMLARAAPEAVAAGATAVVPGRLARRSAVKPVAADTSSSARAAKQPTGRRARKRALAAARKPLPPGSTQPQWNEPKAQGKPEHLVGATVLAQGPSRAAERQLPPSSGARKVASDAMAPGSAPVEALGHFGKDDLLASGAVPKFASDNAVAAAASSDAPSQSVGVDVPLSGEAPKTEPDFAVAEASPLEPPIRSAESGLPALESPTEFDPARVAGATVTSETLGQSVEVDLPEARESPDGEAVNVVEEATPPEPASPFAEVDLLASGEPPGAEPVQVAGGATTPEASTQSVGIDSPTPGEPPGAEPVHVVNAPPPSETPRPSTGYDLPASAYPPEFEAETVAAAATPSEAPNLPADVDPLAAEAPPDVDPDRVLTAAPSNETSSQSAEVGTAETGEPPEFESDSGANAWDASGRSIKVHRLPSGELLGFDERWYLIQNPGVAAAVRRGDFNSGLAHYLEFGRDEGRSPVPPKQGS